MKYHYISLQTAELASNPREVFKIILFDLIHYHFLNYKWHYSKQGY